MCSDIAKLVKVASHKHLFIKDKWTAIEKAMDDLDWSDDDTCLDDVADLMVINQKPIVDENTKAIMKQESEWNALIRKTSAQKAGSVLDEDISWSPESVIDQKDKQEWESILNNVNKIDERYQAMRR